MPAKPRINVGDSATLQATFEANDGTDELIDGLDVVFRTRAPSGARQELAFADGQVDRVSAGVYEATIVVDEPGVWRFGVTGTGAAVGVENGAFEVWPGSPG